MFNFKNISNWLAEVLVGSSSGKYVTPEEAIKYPPIWYAVNKIAGHVGQLPLICYRRLPNGQGAEPASDIAPYKLMRVSPNSWQSPIVFKETMQSHCLLWGNAYAYIVRQSGRPVQLIPLYPGRTAPEILDGVKQYLHLPNNGDDPILRYRSPNNQNYIVFSDEEMLHIPGLGFDGFAGVSLWKAASDSWAIGLESDQRILNGFKKGFKAAMLLEAPPEAFRKEEDARQFISDFNAYHSGSENADKAGLLTRGIKANVVQMNSQEAQMVEHRRYQRQDAALWFLLESILGDNESVSYNSLEQKNLAYLQNCLMRWLVKWEEECNRKLLSQQSERYFFKFMVSDLLRADHKTMMETFSLGITSRIYSPNEARAKLDMNPYEGGDTYENPAITPGQGASEPPPQSEPDNTQTTGETDTTQAALRVVMSQMIDVECRRLEKHAKKDDPVRAIEQFYAKWEVTLGNALEKTGCDRTIAARHCEVSKQLLANAFVGNQMEDVPQLVASCIEDWDLRKFDYGA